MTLCGQYVFGYGSLAARPGRAPTRERRAAGFIADLPGVARGWGVAMDNSVDRAGYKWYADAAGERPDVFVCFLDIDRDPRPGARVNGVCRPVGDAELVRLDARERNYVRIDVSAAIDCGARVWTYAGSADGRARLARGRAAGTAVIHRDYLAIVRRGFQALGPGEWARCAPSLDPHGLPVRALTRVDLPPWACGRTTRRGR